MPRATNKDDLIKIANEQFNKLWTMIDSMSEDEQSASFYFDAAKMRSEAHWMRE